MSRSLNRVQLIGNMTKDPELRYTPNGTAVCTFSIATNRSWTTETGEKKDEAEFHRIVAWAKLAELCSQYLTKGRKVFVEGRLATRSWQGQDGNQRNTTEIVISDMMILDNKRTDGAAKTEEESEAIVRNTKNSEEEEKPVKKTAKKEEKEPIVESKNDSEEVLPDDIPF